MDPVLITLGVGLAAVGYLARAMRKAHADKPVEYGAIRKPWVEDIKAETAPPPKPKRSHKRKPR